MIAIPESLRGELREIQRLQLLGDFPDENLLKYDAIALTYGLGPAVYLTIEGRMIVWDYSNNAPPFETHLLSDLGAYLTIGSRRLNLPGLLTLLPVPDSSSKCHWCNGTRWARLPGSFNEVVCWECNGLGWREASVAEPRSTNNP
jgi:hypothetical protein